MAIKPQLLEIRGGWLAMSDGWAVRGLTRAEALESFKAAERLHAETDPRPLPGEAARPTSESDSTS